MLCDRNSHFHTLHAVQADLGPQHQNTRPPELLPFMAFSAARHGIQRGSPTTHCFEHDHERTMQHLQASEQCLTYARMLSCWQGEGSP